MTHKLTSYADQGYTAELFKHKREEGEGDFIRLGHPNGDVIWLGTMNGTDFEVLPQDLHDDLEADYVELQKERTQ